VKNKEGEIGGACRTTPAFQPPHKEAKITPPLKWDVSLERAAGPIIYSMLMFLIGYRGRAERRPSDKNLPIVCVKPWSTPTNHRQTSGQEHQRTSFSRMASLAFLFRDLETEVVKANGPVGRM